MNRASIVLIIGFLFASIGLRGQDTTVVVVRDTLTYQKLINSLGKSVSSSDSLNLAMNKQIEKNKKRRTTGFRLRIFFDNSQNARNVSEQIVFNFSKQYPDIPVYRVYVNPYFKVTVGDFRTKSDAMRFLNQIKAEYPSAFIVRESFSTI